MKKKAKFHKYEAYCNANFIVKVQAKDEEDAYYQIHEKMKLFTNKVTCVGEFKIDDIFPEGFNEDK